MYEIKSYEKGYEKELSAISLSKPWTHFRGYTPEGFKGMSSKKDFDPEINLIAFHDGKVIGYLLSYLEIRDGNSVPCMWLPVTKLGYEEAQIELINHVLEIYKQRNYPKVITNQGSEWEELHGIPEKFGFQRTIDLVLTVRKKISEFNITDFPKITGIELLNRKKHYKYLFNFYKEKENSTEDKQIEDYLENRIFNPIFKCWILLRNSEFLGVIKTVGFNKPNNPEAIRKIFWIFKFDLKNQKDENLI
jgi:hypothetical protein